MQIVEAVISLENYVIKENDLSFMVCTVLSSDPNVCKVAMDIDITLIFEDGTASEFFLFFVCNRYNNVSLFNTLSFLI